MIAVWKIYQCQYCWHKRVVQINTTQPHCTMCKKNRMHVVEWIV